MQWHVKLPFVFSQTAFNAQSWLLIEHSSISQLTPRPALLDSPLSTQIGVLQAHVKLPIVSVHAAFRSQLSMILEHSSTLTHKTPDPEYPELQLQVKLPIASLHLAFE
jgi:hypothetical protein